MTPSPSGEGRGEGLATESKNTSVYFLIAADRKRDEEESFFLVTRYALTPTLSQR